MATIHLGSSLAFGLHVRDWVTPYASSFFILLIIYFFNLLDLTLRSRERKAGTTKVEAARPLQKRKAAKISGDIKNSQVGDG